MTAVGRDSASAVGAKHSLWVELLLYPGHTLPTAAAPIVVAVGVALRHHVFAPGPALAAFVASSLIHVAGVFTDNYVLVTKHSSIDEHPELLAALASGELTLTGLRWAIAACLAGAACLAPYLAGVVGWPVVVVLGVGGTLVSLWYAAGPVSMEDLGIADPVFFVMFAYVAVGGTYAAQLAATWGAAPSASMLRLALPRELSMVGLPIGSLTTIVLLIDELRDREFDRAKGWRTGVVRFGLGWTRTEMVALAVLAYAVPILLCARGGFGRWVLLPEATLPEALLMLRTVTRSSAFADLFPMTPRASRLVLVFSILYAVGLAL